MVDCEEMSDSDMSDTSSDGSSSPTNELSGPETNQKKRKKDEQDGVEERAAKMKKGNLFKPPTHEELQTLKETGSSLHSSLFRLQVDELLTEVSVKLKWRKEMEDFLHQLTVKLLKVKKSAEQDLDDMSWLKKTGLQLPVHLKSTGVKGKFKFLAPRLVKVVGSFVNNTSVKPLTDTDLVVVMPKECFQAKDHLNQRYLRKRALYLTYLAQHLRKWAGQSELSFTHHHGNRVKPVLLVKPAGKLGSHLCVRIHAVPESDSFKLNRFHISKNNVRTKWFNDENTESVEEEDEEPVTPHYNTDVLSDLTSIDSSSLIEQHLLGHKSLKEALQLLKVWLHQRELSQSAGSLNGFILSMYMVYLLKNKRLSTIMTSYQVVKNVLFHLSTSDWCSHGITLCEDSNDPRLPTLQQFHQHFSVVFVDQSGYNNLTAYMSTATFNRVKHEAGLAVKWLETPGLDAFEVLFMKQVPFISKFDQVVHISSLHELKRACDSLGLSESLLDYSGDFVGACTQGLIDLLQQALGKRLLLLDVRHSPSPKWSITENPPAVDHLEKITFGFLLNPDTYTSVIERGPPADTLEAVKFRSFWGDISELRRFQDGGICEAAVWDCKTVAERRRVVGKIVKHILNRHCDLPRECITIVGNQLDDVLRLPNPKKKKKKDQIESKPSSNVAEFVYGTGEEQHTAILRVYDDLCKDLRSLRDLPLAISTIQGTGEVFRYSQVFPNLPVPFTPTVVTKNGVSCPDPDQPAPPFTPFIPVLCMLETSGKWPDDLEAVKRVKAAFHLQLSNLLVSKCDVKANPFPTHVDILKGGYVFRVEVGYSKEIVLLKTVRTPEGMVKMVENEESRQLERKLNFIPKLTTTLQSIQQRYPGYCCSVRLAKRWLSAHMFLGEYFKAEAVELIMTYIYLHPAPYSVPSGSLAGFLRFLHLLSSWDWKVQPMMVNLNDKFDANDFIEIPKQFSKNRSTLPLMFISTPEDKHTSQWTRHQPCAPVLNRVALLAQESLTLLQSQLESTKVGLDFKHVFRPPLTTFDLLIHLHSEQVSTQHESLDATPNNCLPFYKTKSRANAMPVVNYNPAQIYFKELQAAFGELALFFYDICGGSVIGVIWKPHALTNKTFKVSHLVGHMPHSTGDGVGLTLNVEAVVADMKYMGTGLVSDVQLHTDKWNVA